jgi:hypothetical protein
MIYGLPNPDIFDFEKYEVGGCCVCPGGNDPDVQCIFVTGLNI